MKRFHFIIILLALTLTGCGGGAVGSPEGAVEDYLEALVTLDADRLVNLSCAEWEATARTEVDSFQAVSAELVGVTCMSAGTRDNFSLVTCTGAIEVTYDGEAQALTLEAGPILLQKKAVSGACVDGSNPMVPRMAPMADQSENLLALLLCLIVIMVIIMTADQSPQWIYEGF